MRLPRFTTSLRPTPTLNSQIQIRQYTPTLTQRYPTAIARAERAADLKKHPEAALTQQKLADAKGNRHWTEENATLSEADIRADHESTPAEKVAKEDAGKGK
ncbi:hypothetical protein LTR84_009567 [Exophiala bonariae]|uniref:Uncharacterized protein n=1 Tax=Exophiala bonariae TaxID=1690606 RepID=A0AAV9NIK7_9EURO|nr:hypothetical protein LTR84_009567 [Exophiala bonariae]